jgi:hypothetical protein
MWRKLGQIAIGTAMAAAACRAQTPLGQTSAGSSTAGGFRLYGVSLFAGYATSPDPLYSLPSGPGALGPDENYGASVAVGWELHREQKNVAIKYSGTYLGMAHYSGLNNYSQNLSFTASGKLSPKWSWSVSGSGEDDTLAELLFEPTALSATAQLPTNFDDFAAAMGLGQFSSAQAASTILGAPVLQSPLQTLVLGAHVLSYSGQAGLTYSYSPTLSFHFSGGWAGYQSLPGSQSDAAQLANAIPRSTNATADMGASYSLSPRTDVGLDVQENRQQDQYESAYISTATASLGRKMGSHWFARVYGGESIIQLTQQTYGTAGTRELVGGGSIGAKTYTQSFIVSYDRTAFDEYGFAAGTDTDVMGTWNWHHPGSRWSIFTSFGEMQMRNNGFASISGWEGNAGLSERLTDHTSLSAGYVYLSSGGSYVGNVNNISFQGVRVSLNWSPQLVLP